MRNLLIASILFLIFCGCKGLDPQNPFYTGAGRNPNLPEDYHPAVQPIGYPLAAREAKGHAPLGNNRNYVLMKYRQGLITREEWWAWQESRGEEKLTELNNGFERDSRVVKKENYNDFSEFLWAIFEAVQPWSAKHKIK